MPQVLRTSPSRQGSCITSLSSPKILRSRAALQVPVLVRSRVASALRAVSAASRRLHQPVAFQSPPIKTNGGDEPGGRFSRHKISEKKNCVGNFVSTGFHRRRRQSHDRADPIGCPFSRNFKQISRLPECVSFFSPTSCVATGLPDVLSGTSTSSTAAEIRSA